MIQWGINALNHGSSIAVFNNGEYVDSFSYSTDEISPEQFKLHIDGQGSPDRIYWYENPWLKKARQLHAKQWSRALDFSALPRRYLKTAGLNYVPITYTPHHASHAAAGYYTSPFNHCAVVVLDAIGEFECATIWNCVHGEMQKVWSRRYPHSLGLFYSAFTDMLGMTAIQDEYQLQQMALQGNPSRFRNSVDLYFDQGELNLRYNFHKGVNDWSCETWTEQERFDLAAAVQERFELEVDKIMSLAKVLTNSDNLVYMGGCAMNSKANTLVVEPKFKNIWSLPNPGDASSSIGAVLYHTKQRVWRDWGVAKHIKVKV